MNEMGGVMVEKTIEVNYEEGEGLFKMELRGTVTIKRMSFSERNEMEAEGTEIRVTGGAPQVKVNSARMKEFALLKAVTKSSLSKTTYYTDPATQGIKGQTYAYPWDYAGIRDLPQDVGEQLFDEFVVLNTVSPKKNVTLS